MKEKYFYRAWKEKDGTWTVHARIVPSDGRTGVYFHNLSEGEVGLGCIILIDDMKKCYDFKKHSVRSEDGSVFFAVKGKKKWRGTVTMEGLTKETKFKDVNEVFAAATQFTECMIIERKACEAFEYEFLERPSED